MDLKLVKCNFLDHMNQEYNKVVKIILELANSISEDLLSMPVVVEPGFEVRSGRQFKIIAKLHSGDFSQNLIKFYVPSDGYPVVINHSSKEITIDSEAYFLDFIYNELFNNKDLLSQLRALIACNQAVC